MFTQTQVKRRVGTRAIQARAAFGAAPPRRGAVPLLLGLLLGPALAGCSDEATVVGEEPAAPVGERGPLYLVATTFSAGDQDETYFVTSPSFDAATSIDSTNGPKLIGGVVPTVYRGAVFAPDSAGPVITRFDVDASDQLEPGPQLSFAGVGMTRIESWHIYIVRDKGYVFDPAGSRLILWDPVTMTLTGEQIELPMIVREGWVPNLVFEHSGPVLRGNTLLVPLAWQDLDFNSRHASGVLALDIETDQVVSVDEDERCGESYATITAPNGDVYFFPPDWSSSPHYFADMFQPTCVLHVPAGATAFDGGAPLGLSALGTGLAAAGAVPDGQAGFFFTAVDEVLWDGGNNEGGAVWKTFHYDLSTQVSRAVDALPAWSGQLYYVNVGGAFFIPYWRETGAGSETTLYSVGSGDTDPTPLFSFEGNWYGVSQLR
jgi:hypothetical protein